MKKIFNQQNADEEKEREREMGRKGIMCSNRIKFKNPLVADWYGNKIIDNLNKFIAPA